MTINEVLFNLLNTAMAFTFRLFLVRFFQKAFNHEGSQRGSHLDRSQHPGGP